MIQRIGSTTLIVQRFGDGGKCGTSIPVGVFLADRACNSSARCRALSVLQSLRHLTYWAHVQRTPFLPILATVVYFIQHRVVGSAYRG